jgi:hypothetical protein
MYTLRFSSSLPNKSCCLSTTEKKHIIVSSRWKVGGWSQLDNRWDQSEQFLPSWENPPRIIAMTVISCLYHSGHRQKTPGSQVPTDLTAPWRVLLSGLRQALSDKDWSSCAQRARSENWAASPLCLSTYNPKQTSQTRTILNQLF